MSKRKEDVATVLYSESPIDDIWLRLNRFKFDANLRQHRAVRTGTLLLDDDRAEVAASIQQSQEYFRAGSTASLHTAPLHLYYGMLNLLKATTSLLNGSCGPIAHHGMTMPLAPATGPLGAAELHVDGRARGGLAEYAASLQSGNNLGGGQVWSLSDLLGTIPDLFEDHRTTYGSTRAFFCVPIERVRISATQAIDRVDTSIVPSFSNMASGIAGITDRYLKPQQAGNVVVLRPKLHPIDDIAYESLSGRRFFIVAHHKDGKPIALHPLLATYMAMFILGTLSRYHARFWSRFVTESQDDERHLIDMFIRLSVRLFPNVALDTITAKKHVFTTSRHQDTDLREFAVKADIESMISEGITDALRRATGATRQ